MKSKLFILPLLLVGSLLGGCKEKEEDPIYIEEWLNNAKQPFESDWSARFRFRENDEDILYKDYELSVANSIKNIVKDIEAKPIKEVRHKVLPLMQYWIYADIGKFDSCKLYFYDDGVLETQATYSNNKPGIISYSYQNFSYELGEEKMTSLYNAFKTRYAEIQEDRAKEDQENQNKVSIENFLEVMDSSKETHYIMYNIRQTGSTTSKKIQDNDLSYLKDIKDLEFTKLNKNKYIYSRLASYYIDDEWALVFPEDSYNEVAVCYINVNSKYKENSIYSQKWYFAHYSVNYEKLKALLDKMNNQVAE